jgi:hypothetical protein
MTRVADILVIVGLVFVAWYQINAGLQFVFVSFFNLLGVDLRTWFPLLPLVAALAGLAPAIPLGMRAAKLLN